KLGTAAEQGLGWPTGTFEHAYAENRRSGSTVALEASALGPAIIDLVNDVGDWSGTATELLLELNNRAESNVVRQRSWPKTPGKLSGEVKRLAQSLRSADVEVERDKTCGSGSRKLIALRRALRAPSPEGVASVAGVATSGSSDPAGISAYGSNRKTDKPEWM